MELWTMGMEVDWGMGAGRAESGWKQSEMAPRVAERRRWKQAVARGVELAALLGDVGGLIVGAVGLYAASVVPPALQNGMAQLGGGALVFSVANIAALKSAGKLHIRAAMAVRAGSVVLNTAAVIGVVFWARRQSFSLQDPIGNRTAWAVIALAAVANVAAVLIRPGAKPGACVCAGCGYDLAGNVTGVCPECGACVKRAGA
jgi:hypothetical protein